MKLTDIKKRIRLAAYLDAGERIATDNEVFSCHALNDAFRAKDALPPREFFFSEDNYWRPLFCDGREDLAKETVETRDKRWARYEEDHGRHSRAVRKVLSTPGGKLTPAMAVTTARLDRRMKVLEADAKNTRLMMLALIHAIDEAGDLRGVLS